MKISSKLDAGNLNFVVVSNFEPKKIKFLNYIPPKINKEVEICLNNHLSHLHFPVLVYLGIPFYSCLHFPTE